MVKSVKAIILASVMVSMSVMLINSCGVSSPTAASTGNTSVSGLSASAGCVPSVPGVPDPSIYLPTGISSDAAKALLENPCANPTASPSAKKPPIKYPCGTYTQGERYVGGATLADGSVVVPKDLVTYDVKGLATYYTVHYIFTTGPNNFIVDSATVISYTTSLPILPPDSHFTIPCNLFPNGIDLPPDFFLGGKSYPDGDYVIGGDWFSLVGGKATWKGRVTPCTPDGARPKKPKTLTDLTIEPATLTVGVGQTASFSAIAHYSDGSTQDVTAPARWSTQISGIPFTPVALMGGTTVPTTNKAAALNALSVTTPAGLNAAIAANPTGAAPSVSNGIVSSPTKSSVLVLADYTEGGITKSAQGTATFDNKYTAIKITPSKATVYIHNDPKTATFTAKGVLPPNNIQEVINNNDINWSSSDTNMATIDNTGKATAGTTPGAVQIKAAYIPDNTLFSNPDAELNVECRIYTQYQQNAGWWANEYYAYHKYDNPLPKKPDGAIGAVGCAVTSSAMAISGSGTIINPGFLDMYMTQYLPKYTFYDKGNGVNFDPAIPYFSNGKMTVTAIDFNQNSWINYLNNCNTIITFIHSRRGHYVFIYKYSNGNFIAYDPLYPGEQVIDPSRIINGILCSY